MVAGLLLATGGCANQEAYGVVGDGSQVFTGQMSGGEVGRITLDNGQGTHCVGEFSGRHSTAVDVAKILIIGPGSVTPSAGSGRALLSCSDGQQAVIQFSSTGGGSGYGYGSTRGGLPVRFTYGMTRDQSAPYLQVAATAPGGGPSRQPARTSSGTGFFVTRQGHILTNAHVVEGCAQISVARVGSTPASATVLARDQQNDLAVLQTAASPSTIAALHDSGSVRQGQPVVAFGFPLPDTISSGGSLTTGSISALTGFHDDTRYFQMSAPIQPGNSGGPLMDMTGAVIGVNSASLNSSTMLQRTGAVPQNVNFALKSSVVKTFLDSAGVTLQTAAGGQGLSVPDIGEHARAFSVLIECRK